MSSVRGGVFPEDTVLDDAGTLGDSTTVCPSHVAIYGVVLEGAVASIDPTPIIRRVGVDDVVLNESTALGDPCASHQGTVIIDDVILNSAVAVGDPGTTYLSRVARNLIVLHSTIAIVKPAAMLCSRVIRDGVVLNGAIAPYESRTTRS